MPQKQTGLYENIINNCGRPEIEQPRQLNISLLEMNKFLETHNLPENQGETKKT